MLSRIFRKFQITLFFLNVNFPGHLKVSSNILSEDPPLKKRKKKKGKVLLNYICKKKIDLAFQSVCRLLLRAYVYNSVKQSDRNSLKIDIFHKPTTYKQHF